MTQLSYNPRSQSEWCIPLLGIVQFCVRICQFFQRKDFLDDTHPPLNPVTIRQISSSETSNLLNSFISFQWNDWENRTQNWTTPYSGNIWNDFKRVHNGKWWKPIFQSIPKRMFEMVPFAHYKLGDHVTFLSTAKKGDNALGSVHPSVHFCLCLFIRALLLESFEKWLFPV